MSRNRSRGMLLAVLALAALAVLAGCKQFSFFSVLGDRLHDTPLAISPATVTVPMSGTVIFSATGGQTPYSFTLISGSGTIDTGTGLYTAPATAGTASVRVTDAQVAHSDAAVNITGTAGPLAISPTSVTMGPGGSLTFVATGGTAPYLFSLTASGSGSPSINSSTGAYTAGASTGTDTVQVQDALSATANATVTVTAVQTNVDYTVSATNFPSNGTGGSAISGGYFTIQNGGAAPGAQPVSWWVYISDDATLGSGDSLLSGGSAAALSSGATENVPLAGSWPLSSGAKRLFVMVSSADDLSVGNNTSAGIPVTLALPDYSAAAAHSSGTTAGAAFTATLTIDNASSASGAQDITWSVYASLDNTAIDAGDKLVASGTISGGLAGSTSSGALPIANTWPATSGSYYLIADIFAGDDGNTGNNCSASAAVAVTAPPTPNVDYGGTLSGGSPTRAGSSFSASLTISNGGAAAGSRTVYWSVYASLGDTGIDAGDKLVGSGSIAGGLPAPGSSGPLAISSSWPSVTGTYYLVAQILADDDTNTLNNTPAGGAITVGMTDYSGVVAHSAGTTAGAAFSGTLSISNIGGVLALGGSQAIYWNVYASLEDTVISAEDKVVASGTIAGLGAGASSGALPIANTWPATAGSYYLIADIFAGDDGNTGNNRPASGAVAVTAPPAPGADYSGSVSHLSGTSANRLFTGSLSITNSGMLAGTSTVVWTVYASLGDMVVSADDKVVSAGTTGGLLAGGSAGPLAISNTWPATAGNYFLVAVVQAADDVNPGNNLFASTGVVVNPPNVDYLVQNVTYTGGTANPGAAVSGSFVYRNQGADAGLQPVFWTVYASLNTTLDASDTWLASGTADPLGGLVTSTPAVTFSGLWPLDYGSYYLLVTTSNLEDLNGTNNQAASTVSTAIGMFTGPLAEYNHEPNNDYLNLVQVYDLGVTLRPGMSLYLEGSMPKITGVDDLDDVLGVNSGTATTITASMTWTGKQNMALYIWTGPSSLLKAVSIASAESLSISWAAAPGTQYWIDVTNGPPAMDLAAYTLIITAN